MWSVQQAGQEKPARSSVRCLCDVATHQVHIGISNEEYAELQLSDEPWCCKRCFKEAVPFHDVSSSDSIFNASADAIIDTSADDDSLTPRNTISGNENQQLQSPPNALSILYTNCRSVLPKLDHLRLLASTQNPHLIAVTETWLDDTISDNEVTIPGYQLVRRDRNRHGGGIAILIQDHLPFTVILSHASAELLVIELRLRHSIVLCGLFYRPPSSDATVLTDVESALEQLPPSKTRSFVLLGDFNIDRSPTSSHPLLPILLSFEDTLGLKQVVATATRTTTTTSSIIDHIYVSENLTNS